MQICYRCNEKTNRLLEQDAHEKSISKNRLIDGIIQDYLCRNHQAITALSTVQTEKELLSYIRSANERLAQILGTIDYIQTYVALRDDQPDSQSKIYDITSTFRSEMVNALPDIARAGRKPQEMGCT